MGFEIENGVLREYIEEDGITDVVIPDVVTSIGDNAFLACENLTSITIPDSVTSIGVCAFSGCENLTSINIPDGITSIGDCMFYYCDSLTSINIPDSVTYIGKWAFGTCYNLKSITIHDNITHIEKNAFENCLSLELITIKSKNSSIIIYDEITICSNDLYKNIQNIIKFMKNEIADKDTILDNLEDFPYKLAVAIYILKKYNTESAKYFIEYNIEYVVISLIDNNDAENLTYILTLGYVTKENIDIMIKYAIDRKKPEMQVILSNYKNDNFGFNDNFNKFML